MAFPPPPVLVLDRCVLRPYHPADAAALRAAADDPAVARFMRDRFPHPYTAADAAAWLASVAADVAGLSPDGSALALAVCRRADGAFLGGVALFPPGGGGAGGGDPTERATRELGYWLARAAWGHGYATEVARGLARWALGGGGPGTPPPPPPAFAHHPLERVQAAVMAPNTASQAVLARAGFVREGVRRRALVKHGVVLDEVLYGLVRSDLEGEAAPAQESV